jgi:hypothetical protein
MYGTFESSFFNEFDYVVVFTCRAAGKVSRPKALTGLSGAAARHKSGSKG